VIAAILLLGVCATPLTFDSLGPPCSDPLVECRCSECFTWDDSPRATRYEIERTTVSTGTVFQVGTLYYQPSYFDDEYQEMVPEVRPQTVWCGAKDAQFPHEGTHYRYRVKACNSFGCSVPSAQVDYVAAPYSCMDNGVEKQCYAGDPLIPGRVNNKRIEAPIE